MNAPAGHRYTPHLHACAHERGGLRTTVALTVFYVGIAVNVRALLRGDDMAGMLTSCESGVVSKCSLMTVGAYLA